MTPEEFAALKARAEAARNGKHGDLDLRCTVDILVALGVLPDSFSTAYAAGRAELEERAVEVRRLRAEKAWLLGSISPALRAEFRLCAQTSEVARAEEPNYAELLKELHGHMFTCILLP